MYTDFLPIILGPVTFNIGVNEIQNASNILDNFNTNPKETLEELVGHFC